jgi:hypothetical protein
MRQAEIPSSYQPQYRLNSSSNNREQFFFGSTPTASTAAASANGSISAQIITGSIPLMAPVNCLTTIPAPNPRDNLSSYIFSINHVCGVLGVEVSRLFFFFFFMAPYTAFVYRTTIEPKTQADCININANANKHVNLVLVLILDPRPRPQPPSSSSAVINKSHHLLVTTENPPAYS